MRIRRGHAWRYWAAAFAAGAGVLVCGEAADASQGENAALTRWARESAAPRLLAAVQTTKDAAEMRLVPVLRQHLETEAGLRSLSRDPAFWAAAVDSREATQLALAAQLVSLAAEGDAERLAEYAQLLPMVRGGHGAVAAVLDELASHLPSSASSGSVLSQGDAALDRSDFALAAFAYRLVLLDAAPDTYAFRDIAGHYFYCLHQLNAAPDVLSSRARFNQTVVFPNVEAQSRARLAPTTAARSASSDPTDES